jgi:hypothetical protein
MRQKRIDSAQRAELAASKPAAAIEGLRPFTVKQGQYLAFIYYLGGHPNPTINRHRKPRH